ncbi:MAG: hypothetical protein C5B50_26710 [Verrucomicrobia bacterium]|nr:MAG: hypothetical protein C5B50_26710 [Verrucomicrobiota bacterium]
MKMRCECGEIISDNTDYLPYKAFLIADEDWFGVADAIDEITSEVASGRTTILAAETAVRVVLNKKSRTMYQCSKCGRLLVADWQHNRHIYAPISDADSRQILRGHDKVS